MNGVISPLWRACELLTVLGRDQSPTTRLPGSLLAAALRQCAEPKAQSQHNPTWKDAPRLAHHRLQEEQHQHRRGASGQELQSASCKAPRWCVITHAPVFKLTAQKSGAVSLHALAAHFAGHSSHRHLLPRRPHSTYPAACGRGLQEGCATRQPAKVHARRLHPLVTCHQGRETGQPGRATVSSSKGTTAPVHAHSRCRHGHCQVSEPQAVAGSEACGCPDVQARVSRAPWRRSAHAAARLRRSLVLNRGDEALPSSSLVSLRGMSKIRHPDILLVAASSS
ncbi:hypothetical protein GWK47_038438 [Chionoecetes opilio]|uniref:Uncharacterized protein n=1 Tax=Chionoecetes opilio TaxID=41210 RepID=A0A8J5CYP4_CHIOP|nr:hypothetical protein GWK47_038438 [Chionoecetes opilio]